MGTPYFKINKKLAIVINKLFFEVIIAKGFDKEALSILKKKNNLRLIDCKNFVGPIPIDTLQGCIGYRFYMVLNVLLFIGFSTDFKLKSFAFSPKLQIGVFVSVIFISIT